MRKRIGIGERVISKIRQRRAAGRKKYGTTMQRTDLSTAQWLQHFQEELMDAAIYCERLIQDAKAFQRSTTKAPKKPATKAKRDRRTT